MSKNRKWLTPIAIVGMSLGIGSTLSGCASTPTREEVRNEYLEAIRFLDDAWNIALSHCTTNVCVEETNTQYLALKVKLHQAYTESLAHEWERADKIRGEIKDTIDKILDKFPDLKGLRDLLRSSIWTEDVQISVDSKIYRNGELVYLGTATSTSIASPCLSGDISLEGTFSSDFGGSWQSAQFAADFTMGDCEVDPSGTAISAIDGGSIKITVPGAGVLYGTVDLDEKSKFTLSPSGEGTMDITFKLEGGATPWFYPISGSYHLVFPVTTHGDRSLGVIVSPQQFRHAFPRPIRGYVDLNGDDVVDQADYAAYLTLFSSGDYRADMNKDGTFEQSDINAWLEDFNYEAHIRSYR